MTRLLLARQCLRIHHQKKSWAAITINQCSKEVIPLPKSSTNIVAGTTRQFHHDCCLLNNNKESSLLLTTAYSRPTSNNNFIKMNHRFFSSAVTVDDVDSDHDDSASSNSNSNSNNDSNVIPFNLADIGEGIKEVELLQWFVQEGERVQQFDRICEVQSDKATVEITSRYDGIVVKRSGGHVGDMVQVGDPLMMIQVDDATAIGGGGAEQSQDQSSQSASTGKLSNQDSSDQQLSIPKMASQFHLASDQDDYSNDNANPSSSSTATATGENKYLATPAVRKLGMEYNLNLASIVGTGPQGRVLKADVMNYLRDHGMMAKTSSSEFALPLTDTSKAPTPAPATDGTASTSTTQSLEQDEEVTLRGYNRLMIQTMTASMAIPHMGYQDDFDLTKLMQHRHNMTPKISILAFVLKATSLAIKDYPIVNASWKDVDKGQITMWKDHNLGVAMDTPRGLVVPVIRQCQHKSLVEIQAALNDLKDIAAAGKLGEEHLTGATFSISNIGSLGGGTYMSPLIVPPQACIGAMGSLQTVPKFDKDGNVVPSKIMNLSWAGDHRMFDGATLARFSNQCKRYLEDPVQMLVAMK